MGCQGGHTISYHTGSTQELLVLVGALNIKAFAKSNIYRYANSETFVGTCSKELILLTTEKLQDSWGGIGKRGGTATSRILQVLLIQAVTRTANDTIAPTIGRSCADPREARSIGSVMPARSRH